MSGASYHMLEAWLAAFAFTQLVEMPIYAGAMRGKLHLAFAASAITHPVVWFVFPRLTQLGLSYWSWVVLAELFAVVVEGLFLKRTAKLRYAMGWALAANLSSVCLGFASRWAFGWP